MSGMIPSQNTAVNNQSTFTSPNRLHLFNSSINSSIILELSANN